MCSVADRLLEFCLNDCHYSLVFFAYMHTTFLITPPLSLQADVTGLCWVRFIGPSSSTLEAPQDDPVLKTYAQLLSEG